MKKNSSMEEISKIMIESSLKIEDVANFLKDKVPQFKRVGDMLVLEYGTIKKTFSDRVYIDIYDKYSYHKVLIFTAVIPLKKGLSVTKKWKILNDLVGSHFGAVRAYLKEDLNQLTLEYFLNFSTEFNWNVFYVTLNNFNQSYVEIAEKLLEQNVCNKKGVTSLKKPDELPYFRHHGVVTEENLGSRAFI